MSERPLLVVPNPVVAGLTPYSPGRPPAAIDLFLDANEGPAAPDGLAEALVAAESLHRYPSAAALEARLAGLLGVEPAAVLVTAGADDALERSIRAVCTPGCRAILTTPSFVMFARYARLAGAEALELTWWQGEWPVDEALGVADERTAVVAVVSPNNPTGAVISRGAFERLADALPRTLVLLDHAYVEFAADDLTEAALERPNVLVFRTFSKARGAAGLRVGWVAGDPRVVGWLRSVGQPYSVSAASLAAADWLLDHRPELRPGHLEAVREQRTRLAGLLGGLGGEPLPSEGNFVLVRLADAVAVRDALAALGIAVRAFVGTRPARRLAANHGARRRGDLRAAGAGAERPASPQRPCSSTGRRARRRLAAPIAQAIIATAAAYGVEVSRGGHRARQGRRQREQRLGADPAAARRGRRRGDPRRGHRALRAALPGSGRHAGAAARPSAWLMPREALEPLAARRPLGRGHRPAARRCRAIPRASRASAGSSPPW